MLASPCRTGWSSRKDAISGVRPTDDWRARICPWPYRRTFSALDYLKRRRGFRVLTSAKRNRGMKTGATPNITDLLVACGDGDQGALDALAPLVQQELHRVAARQMAGERPGHILQPTALINEVHVRLVDCHNVKWQNRAHFFSVAARIMRRILLDAARARDRAKRGGDAVQVSLADVPDVPAPPTQDLVLLDDALKTLETLDPRQSQVVELRFFGGLSLEEVAEAHQVSVGTVRRDWSLAQAWLYRELKGAS
jgi:RNA polymerase sigma factor (TIGR02999 family)